MFYEYSLVTCSALLRNLPSLETRKQPAYFPLLQAKILLPYSLFQNTWFPIPYHKIFRSTLYCPFQKVVTHPTERVKAKYRAHPRILPIGEVNLRLWLRLQNSSWSSMEHFRSPGVMNALSWSEVTIPLQSTQLTYSSLWV